MNQVDIYDVTIIGGGPAGLYSAFYSGLRSLKTKIIEFQPELGGKVHMYPEKMIWDIGGLPPVTGAQLIEQMTSQALTFDPTVVLNEKVIKMSQDENKIFSIHTESGQIHYSKTIIIAIGGGILSPQRIEIDGAEKFEQTNLHYTVKKLSDFKDKTVLITGGGNTAIDWANELAPYAKQVYLSYRKEKLTGHEAHVKQLENSSANIYLTTNITNFIPNAFGDRIETVEITNHETGESTNIAIDDVIINHGYDRDSSLLDDCNCNLNIKRVNEHYIETTTHCNSSVDGIYGAGDIVMYDGKVHLLLGVFQDAVNAVNQAKLYLEPEADKYGMVSSHNDLFDKMNKGLVKELMA